MNGTATHEPSGTPGPGQVPLQDFRVLAVGRAGIHAAELLCGKEALHGMDVVACHSDVSALAGSAAPFKVRLGSASSRGLGSGGDPTLGQASAEASVEAVRGMVAGARVVFVLCGLGAGTGTGAGPVVARCAREAGALVLGVATLPFECEGRLRGGHARRGLELLKSAADVVLMVPNQRVLEVVDERATAPEVFAAANGLMVDGVRGLWRMLMRPGLIRLDFATLERLLRGRHTESVLAWAEGSGDPRAHVAVEALLKHPFLGHGRLLAEADAVVLSAVAGTDVPFCDIERAFTVVQQHCGQAQVVLGTSVEPGMGGRMELTLVASVGGTAPLPEAAPGSTPAANRDDAKAASAPVDMGLGAELPDVTPVPGRASGALVPPAPQLTVEQRQRVIERSGRGPGRRRRAVQSVFEFDFVSRGRFEKTEATILDGQDYDVPTFIRKRISLN